MRAMEEVLEDELGREDKRGMSEEPKESSQNLETTAAPTEARLQKRPPTLLLNTTPDGTIHSALVSNRKG